MALNNPFANRKRDVSVPQKPLQNKSPESVDPLLDMLMDDDDESYSIAPNNLSFPQPSQSFPKHTEIEEEEEALPDLSSMELGFPETSNSSQSFVPTVVHRQPNDQLQEILKPDSPEELNASQKAHINAQGAFSSLYEDSNDPVLSIISRNIKELSRKHPKGGIKGSRYITTEVLVNAPKGYFDKYLEDAKSGVEYVRGKLADSDRSDLVRTAQLNPTDDGLQNDAFWAVEALAVEFMRRSTWRDTHKSIVLSMIFNEIVGFSRIEPLWRDRTIDEILCNGPNDIQIEIKGELLKVPGCSFDDQKHLENLISRLFGSINKTFTMSTALIKGRLHDKSRMFAVHTTVAPDGPNFSIRRHPEKLWTPDALVGRGVASEEIMSYIGNLIYKGASLAVVGGTSSGKTTMLNALTGFYKPKARILTLEDNIEMKPNPKKFLAAAMECRQAAIDKPDDRGITMRDLVKSSLQLRPDVLIVGEVTDDAAFDLCQALNTGHAGASTIHANSAEEAIPRIASLITQGGLASLESSLELISSAFDFIVCVKRFNVDGSRRIVSVDEVGTVPMEVDGRIVLPVKPLWKFMDQGLDSEGKVTGYWEQLGDISQRRIERKFLDTENDMSWESLKELSSIPEQE